MAKYPCVVVHTIFFVNHSHIGNGTFNEGATLNNHPCDLHDEGQFLCCRCCVDSRRENRRCVEAANTIETIGTCQKVTFHHSIDEIYASIDIFLEFFRHCNSVQTITGKCQCLVVTRRLTIFSLPPNLI